MRIARALALFAITAVIAAFSDVAEARKIVSSAQTNPGLRAESAYEAPSQEAFSSALHGADIGAPQPEAEKVGPQETKVAQRLFRMRTFKTRTRTRPRTGRGARGGTSRGVKPPHKMKKGLSVRSSKPGGTANKPLSKLKKNLRTKFGQLKQKGGRPSPKRARPTGDKAKNVLKKLRNKHGLKDRGSQGRTKTASRQTSRTLSKLRQKQGMKSQTAKQRRQAERNAGRLGSTKKTDSKTKAIAQKLKALRDKAGLSKSGRTAKPSTQSSTAQSRTRTTATGGGGPPNKAQRGAVSLKKSRHQQVTSSLRRLRQDVKAGWKKPSATQGAANKLNSAHAKKVAKTLGSWRSYSAKRVNAKLAKEGLNNPPPYKPGTKVYNVTTKKAASFVRVYNQNGSRAGRWLMRQKDIAGLSPKQIQQKFALPTKPTYMTRVDVPKGTNLRVGRVNKGNAIQYELQQRIHPRNFSRGIGLE